MTKNPTDYLFIGATVLLTVYGQLILKWRLLQLNPVATRGAGEIRQLLLLLLDPVILSGLLAAVLASVAWMGALKRFDLGFAYPFMSLNFAIAVVLGAWLFGETLSVQRVLGVAVIIAGTTIAARA